MWKISPVVACVGLLLAVSAQTAEAQMVDEHGRFCCPLTPRQFQGQLSFNFVTQPWLKDTEMTRIQMPRIVWRLSTAGKLYDLDFGESKALREQAWKLMGQNVIIHGWPTGGAIRVVSLSVDVPIQGLPDVQQPRFDLKTLIGLDLGKAGEIAGRHGYSIRVTMQDGRPLLHTMDYRLNRINVSVVKGKVISVRIG